MNETREAVLDAIADEPVSGPAVAADLDISRAAVWKHVEALREAGFAIEGTGDGYELAGVPEYGGPAVEYGLDAPFSVEYHDSLPSTNDRARDLAEDGASDVVVLADRQTGARGRLDREWAAPAGGVWASLVLRPALTPAETPLLTLAAAVAVARTAREAGIEARIKWPNDVVVGDAERKVAGILTEMEGETDRVAWVVVGVGVNANVDADDLPPEATSLREQVGDVDRRRFVQRLLETMADLRGDPDAILPAWRKLATTLGKRVRVTTAGRTVVGEAVDIERPGTLVLHTDDGTVRVSAGDCEHLRPA
jgi:BirA family biotin operon repressor/biotin-[acetyl-CoA-carboxylase] ligase